MRWEFGHVWYRRWLLSWLQPPRSETSDVRRIRRISRALMSKPNALRLLRGLVALIKCSVPRRSLGIAGKVFQLQQAF